MRGAAGRPRPVDSGAHGQAFRPTQKLAGVAPWGLAPRIVKPALSPRPSRLSLFVERVLPIGILLVALIGAPVLIFSPEGLPRLRGLEREQQSVADENKSLEREIDELHGRVDRLRDDPRAVEEIARDDLGMVRQSEVVFQFAKKRK